MSCLDHSRSAYLHPLSLLLLSFAGFIGCAPRPLLQPPICPHNKSVAEALKSLNANIQNSVPLRTHGRCVLRYVDDDGKPKTENFPVKLWLNPPTDIYLQGDVAFNPRGITLGCDQNEFWMAVKLKEISTYWWGRWVDQNTISGLQISPEMLLEAFGLIEIGEERQWSLSREGIFDVLTKRQAQHITRKLFIDTCDGRPRKIEYFDTNGRPVAVMELNGYKRISKDFLVPSVTRITNLTADSSDGFVKITLNSIKPKEFSDKKKKALFTRPKTRGFRHVYEEVDGKRAITNSQTWNPENLDTKREVEFIKTEEMTKPIFKNKPNPHLMHHYNSGDGVKVHQDFWISRAPAVVGIIFAFGVEGGARVLVIKRSPKMRDEPNKYGAPSGYLDWDENAFDAMVREVYEETSMYLPDYDPFLTFNNYEQPFYVHSDPETDKNQNVSLTYIMVYDFHKEPDFFPADIEKYSDHETAKVEWLKLQDFYNSNYEWAFNHNKRIEMALRYYNKIGK